MSRFWLALAAVVRKDLLLEWRSREGVLGMGFFSLLVVVLFGFAFQTEQIDLATQAPGLLWSAFSFAGVLGLNRAQALERENGCLRALGASPVDRAALFLGKVLSNFLLILFVELVTLPCFAVLLHVPVAACLPQMALITCLGTLGFAEVGTLLSGMSHGSRLREVILPLILYPVWIPILVASVEATGLVLSGHPLAEAGDFLVLVLVFDLVFLGIGIMTYDAVLEE